MSRKGQHNYKGINAQSWAAMSLFLQYLRDPNFSHIELEATGFEDFNLVFKDGRKIICESKAWEKAFGYPHLKGVLQTILSKNAVGEHDEILIICASIDQDMNNAVEQMEYWGEVLTPKFKKKRFSDHHIAVLGQVRFWHVREKHNHLVVYSLFSELLDFWLPEDELEAQADHLLRKKIYEGSAHGAVYTKEDILSEIREIRARASTYSGYFDDARVAVEVQLQSIIDAIDDNRSPVWAEVPLKALSSKPSLMFFALEKLAQRKIQNLREWHTIWQLSKVYRFSFRLFKIFQENAHTDENRRYILDFLKDHIADVRRFYQRDFFDVEIVEIIKNIVETDQRFAAEGFEVIKKLIEGRSNELFYLKSVSDDSWDKEEICKLLKYIYEHAEASLKEALVRFVLATFNVIEGAGEFYHPTPRDIFWILRDWLGKDVEQRLTQFVRILAEQHTKFYRRYRKNIQFDGWEYIGGITSSWGNKYVVSDKHFVSDVLQPVLVEYYRSSRDKEKAWKFIKRMCIATTGDVSTQKPDFLNRAVIPMILERYAQDETRMSGEAFEMLRECILARKGIPHKSELIYQAIRGDSRFSDEKKWRLVALTVRRYGVPGSVFVEDIVAALAQNNHAEAKRLIKQWLDDDRYYQRFSIKIRILETARGFLELDFPYAVELLTKFVLSDFFVNKQDPFYTDDAAALLYEMLKKDFDAGRKIWEVTLQRKHLSKNQQILIASSLFNSRSNDESDDLKLLTRVYRDFIDPLLSSFNNDIKRITERFPFSQFREALVRFAGRLAYHQEIGKALRIVGVFVNDPDPYLPGQDPEDSEDQHNEHKSILEGKEPRIITSVRGRCCWVLMQCSVLEGRAHIPTIIDLVEQLSQDQNWYVKHMACFALDQLAQKRLAVLPHDRHTLFFNDDQATALRVAKRVEDMAFALLGDIAKASTNVQKALAKSILHVFDPIRTLNEQDAWKLLNALSTFPQEAIAEAAFLFVYYAEFRKNAYEKWEFALPGLYDDLGPDKFSDEKFKKLLLKVIDGLEPDKRFSFGAQFEKIMRDAAPSTDDGKQSFALAYTYLKYLLKDFGRGIFQIIYIAVREGITHGYDFDKLYELFLTCLQQERDFYRINVGHDNIAEMYWWPSLYNGEILELIYEKGGQKKFLNAIEIILEFSKELEIHIDNVIPLLDNFSTSDKRIKGIVKQLFDRNPGKYYDLYHKWLGRTRQASRKS